LFFGFPIPETPFAYEIFIQESSKTVKGNFNIVKNVGVQEEKCKRAGRNTQKFMANAPCTQHF